MKAWAKILQASGKEVLLPMSVERLDEETAVNESYDKAGRT